MRPLDIVEISMIAVSAAEPDVDSIFSPLSHGDNVTFAPAEFTYTMKLLAPATGLP